MKVVSVNIGEKREVLWRGKTVQTGIFKSPVSAIQLCENDVQNDHVMDRRYHGGIDKACYLFSANAYDHFKKFYPGLDWDWGMFGENVTLEGLDESEVFIGSTYRLGSAVVEVSQPRQPCFKLGIRFGNQKVLKDFISAELSGVYVRVIEPGVVKPEHEMKLMNKGSDISVRDIFKLLYRRHEKPALAADAVGLEKLAKSAKKDLGKSL